MLLNIIRRSFENQKKAMGLMIISIAVGTALAASLLTLSFEIDSKVAKELRAFGANIVVEPRVEGLADISGQRRFLRYEDIVKTKTIFWRHNILGVAPFLDDRAVITAGENGEQADLVGAWYERQLPLPGESKEFAAGIVTVSPGWYIEGAWPRGANEAVVGTTIASRMGIRKGDTISVDGTEHAVTGIIDTGGREDDQVFMDLEAMQALRGLEGRVSRVSVSALTTPMDEFAYKEPETMSRTEYEKWYCTGYVTSIAKQVEEVFAGSRAKPVWQIAETEGRVLGRLKLLIYLLCVIALIASALGVSTTMIMSLLRRIEEIGLMKAVGADRAGISMIFLTEGLIIGLTGGVLGYLLSLLASYYIGVKVFDTALEQRAVLFFIAIGNAMIIAIAGTILPIRRAFGIKPGIVLKGAE